MSEVRILFMVTEMHWRCATLYQFTSGIYHKVLSSIKYCVLYTEETWESVAKRKKIYRTRLNGRTNSLLFSHIQTSFINSRRNSKEALHCSHCTCIIYDATYNSFSNLIGHSFYCRIKGEICFLNKKKDKTEKKKKI